MEQTLDGPMSGTTVLVTGGSRPRTYPLAGDGSSMMGSLQTLEDLYAVATMCTGAEVGLAPEAEPPRPPSPAHTKPDRSPAGLPE
jgi:hypothetical protein